MVWARRHFSPQFAAAVMQHLNPATTESISQGSPGEADVRAELERVLSSQHLQASDRRRAFLRFIVEESLSGRADRLKGYTVALAVFGRDETFDPQADPVVRLEARRLRRDLDGYYVDAGSHDAVRISIPKGSYVPRFEWHDTALLPPRPGAESDTQSETRPPGAASHTFDGKEKPRRAWTRYLMIGGVAAAVVAIAWAGWTLMSRPAETQPTASSNTARGPSVVVLPFKALGTTNDSQYLAAGISQELVGNLMRFPSFRLYTLPIGFETDEPPDPTKLARDLSVAYVVSGSVHAEVNDVHVSTQMVDATTGQVLWVGTYDRPLTPEALIKVQREIAGEIAARLGQPYGVVNADLEGRIELPAVSNMESYSCVLRAYVYRRSFSRQEYDPVFQCLKDAVLRDPRYSDAWAMLGWLHMDAGRFASTDDGQRSTEYEKAMADASRAITLDPDNTLALKALSSINHYMGRFDEAERLARRAQELNPYDPDTLVQLGWRLAIRGKFDEGIPILKQAIERSVNPPGWYFHLITIDLYLKGEYKQMLEVAERSSVDGSPFSQAAIAIAAGALSDREATQVALGKLPKSGPLAHGVDEFLRRHGATDEIIGTISAGLERARGVASGQ